MADAMTVEEAVRIHRALANDSDEARTLSFVAADRSWRVLLAHAERTLASRAVKRTGDEWHGLVDEVGRIALVATREGEGPSFDVTLATAQLVDDWHTLTAENAALRAERDEALSDAARLARSDEYIVEEENARLLEEAETLTGEFEVLRATLEAVDSACLAVCSDNTPEVLGGEADSDLGRYLCLNENGDELIDTDDPAEVVRALADLWGQVSEKLDAMQAERDALRARVEAVRKVANADEWHGFPGYVRTADILDALEDRPDA